MPIKDKDGSIYKLRGPNPIMDNQEVWDKSKLTFINFNWEPIIVENNKFNNQKSLEGFNLDIKEKIISNPIKQEEILITEKPKKKKKKKRPLIEELLPKPQLEPEPIPIKEPIVEKQQIESKTAQLLDKHKKMFHCLPSVLKIVDNEVMNGWGENIQFAGVIINETPNEILFWTDKKVSLKSIVFPKNDSKMCWRIQKMEPQSVGYTYYGTPSDFNPNFSNH